MGWIYLACSDRSTCSAGEEPKHEPYRRGSCLPPTVKSIDTPSEYFWQRWHEERFRLRLSVTIYARSLPTCCHSDPTSLLLPCPVKDFPVQVAVKAWITSQAHFSSKCSDLSLIFDPPSCSWKTAQQSLFEEGQKSWPDLPRFGMIRDGACCPLKKSAMRAIKEIDGGAYLPTPTVSQRTNQGGGSGIVGKDRHSLSGMAKREMVPTPCKAGGGRAIPEDANFSGLTCAYKKNGTKVQVALDVLAKRKRIPTPTKTDARGRGYQRSRGGAIYMSLIGLAKAKIPAPVKHDEREPHPKDMERRTIPCNALANASMLPGHPQGAYNPEYTEQVLGSRIGHTALPPWAKVGMNQRRGKHSKS